jgi:membrane protein
VTLAARTIDDTIADRVPGLSAEIAFFVVLSLPPLLITVLAGVGFIGDVFNSSFQQDFADFLIDNASTALSSRTVDEVIAPTVESLIVEGRGELLSIAFLITMYTASRAVRVILVSLSIAYDLPHERTGLQQRLWSLGLTLGGIVLGAVVVPLFVAGPTFGEDLDEWLHAPGTALADVWAILYWPIAVVIVTLLIATLYHFAAPWSTPWRRDIPGAVLAMLVWAGGTAGLRFYVRQTISEDATYDPLGSALALLLWLWVTGFAILLGGELNAEIEKMWPVGPHQTDPPPENDPATEPLEVEQP